LALSGADAGTRLFRYLLPILGFSSRLYDQIVMEFDSLQSMLIAVFLLTAVAVVVVCDFLRETFYRRRTAMAPPWSDPYGDMRATFAV
jgi:hypothetical protein